METPPLSIVLRDLASAETRRAGCVAGPAAHQHDSNSHSGRNASHIHQINDAHCGPEQILYWPTGSSAPPFSALDPGRSHFFEASGSSPLPSYTLGHADLPVQQSFRQTNLDTEMDRDLDDPEPSMSLLEDRKRRGRAAPPGRCHSCNRAETPKWMRGPDGERTLCKACGRHYAKLTRKNLMQKFQGSRSAESSSLKPKPEDEVSRWIAKSAESDPSPSQDHSSLSMDHKKSLEDSIISETISNKGQSSRDLPSIHYTSKIQSNRSLVARLETASVPLGYKPQQGAPKMDITKVTSSESQQMRCEEVLRARAISQQEDFSTHASSRGPLMNTHASEEGSATSESTWISDYSGDIPQLGEGHPLLSIKSDVVRIGLLEFQNSQRQHTGSNVATTNGTSTGARSRQPGEPLKKRSRRNEPGDDESRESEDTNELPPKRSRITKRVVGQKPSFACSFAKKDPLKYRCCYAYVMTRVRDVKQHLSRFHQLPIYCPLCMCTFDAEDGRDVHIRAASCLVKPAIRYEGVTRAQKVSLGQRVSSKMSPSDQWFTIFDILFPGHSPRPKSAYMNLELTVELEGFQDLMCAEGSKIISTVIRSSGLIISPMEDSEGDSQALLELAIEDGLQQIAQRWLASLPNTNPESILSQATAADELLNPSITLNSDRLELSGSSSNTLGELSPGITGYQGPIQDRGSIGGGDDAQIPTQRRRYANQAWDEWSSDLCQLGTAGPSNMLARDASNTDQRHGTHDLNDNMEGGNSLWEMINQEEWNSYGDVNPDTSQLPEGEMEYRS